MQAPIHSGFPVPACGRPTSQVLLKNSERLMETAKAREASSMPRPTAAQTAAAAAARAAAAAESDAASRQALEEQERRALLESQRKQVGRAQPSGAVLKPKAVQVRGAG